MRDGQVALAGTFIQLIRRTETAMSEPAERPLDAIGRDLRTCRDVRLGAQAELSEVRRRQIELAEIEAALVMTIEARRRQADRLLDEWLHAVTDGQDPSRVSTSDHGRRLAAA